MRHDSTSKQRGPAGQAASQRGACIGAEVAVAKRNMPDIAWPTIVLTLALLLGYGVSVWLAASGRIPVWLATALDTLIIYAIYTPLHDASHSAVVPRNKRLRWVNTAIGMAAAVPLWMFFHTHRKEHFTHHAKTNTPQDSDLWAKGSFGRVVGVQIPWLLVSYFNPLALYRSCLRFKLERSERWLTLALFGAYSVAAAGVVLGGHGLEFLMLWFIPWFIGLLVMQTLFGWFPHHDHSETGRYRNTRISLWPGAEWLTLQQNLHLIHHMLPTVPFYRYRAVFDEIRPILAARGARIEGFWPAVPAHSRKGLAR